MNLLNPSERIHILGSDIEVLDMDESLCKIENIISNRNPVQHVVVNAGKIVAMQSNERLRSIVNSCEMINADGQAVVWASKLLGKGLPERVAGIDLMYKLVELSARKGYKVYFFGAREEVVKQVVETYRSAYHALKIAGYRNGYWSEDENENLVREIRNSGADILFVAISTPKKEYWLAENIHKLAIPFCMGVGGSFDVVAGLTKRAPLWMQKAGLEWFYRFAQEPRRMWKRYVYGNASFIWLVLKERFGFKPSYEKIELS